MWRGPGGVGGEDLHGTDRETEKYEVMVVDN